MTQRETSAAIDAVAAEWAARVDASPLDERVEAELHGWLAGDVRRLGAYARARAILHHARRAKALGHGFDPDHFESDALQIGAAGVQPLKEQGSEHPTRRRVLGWASGFVAAGAVGAISLSWATAAQAYRTAKGEVRLVPLEDGSRITLNTESEVRVEFGRNTRNIELVSGEVLFDIASDAARPFVVTAGSSRIMATGTSFSVKHLEGQPVEVLVRQGLIRVVGPDRRQAMAKPVTTNQKAIAAHGGVATRPVVPGELARELAWLNGMLAFEDTPLSQAAASFSRYSDVEILLADPRIGDRTITGLFAANNPRGFARSAALSLGLRAEQTSSNVVISR